MPGDLLDETGEIVWSGLDGLTLSDAINALYMVEVERQLVRFFDVLRKKDLPAHDLEMIGAVISGRAAGSGLELMHDADAIEALAKDRDAANKWLAAVSGNPVGLSRARAQAKVALGSGFWQTLDGTGFRAVAEPTDPLDRYGVHLPAWDVASRAWPGRFDEDNSRLSNDLDQCRGVPSLRDDGRARSPADHRRGRREIRTERSIS